MCIWCILKWILLSGKEGQKYFFSSALNNDKFLNENEYKAFDIYIVMFSWSDLFLKSFFFFVFIFKFTVFMF